MELFLDWGMVWARADPGGGQGAMAPPIRQRYKGFWAAYRRLTDRLSIRGPPQSKILDPPMGPSPSLVGLATVNTQYSAIKGKSGASLPLI